MTRILDFAKSILLDEDKYGPNLCELAKALVDSANRVRQRRDVLARIRARITTLSLAANLPPMVWSELCLLDTDLSALVAEMESP